MASAFLWGFIAAGSLIVGGLLGTWLTISKRTLGVVMAFGAGVLISAVAYELVFEAVQMSAKTGFPTFGFFTGAFTFFIADRVIGAMGASDRKAIGATHSSSPSSGGSTISLSCSSTNLTSLTTGM